MYVTIFCLNYLTLTWNVLAKEIHLSIFLPRNYEGYSLELMFILIHTTPEAVTYFKFALTCVKYLILNTLISVM